MDMYFLIVFVIFLVATISFLIYFLQDSTSSDDQYDLSISTSQPVHLTMPTPPQGLEFSPSLITPYPAQAPPLGFKGFHIPTSSTPWAPVENTMHTNNTEDINRTSPYPTEEEIRHMPLPSDAMNSNRNSPRWAIPVAKPPSDSNRSASSQSPTNQQVNCSSTHATNQPRSSSPPPPYTEVDPRERHSSARNRRNRFSGMRLSR